MGACGVPHRGRRDLRLSRWLLGLTCAQLHFSPSVRAHANGAFTYWSEGGDLSRVAKRLVEEGVPFMIGWVAGALATPLPAQARYQSRRASDDVC